MFSHYAANQGASRRLTSSDRLVNDSEAYFHPYEGSGVPSRAATSASGAGAESGRSFGGYHEPSATYPMAEEGVGGVPMEVLYEEGRGSRSPGPASAPASDLELQLSAAADHLLALLQREANDYSAPLTVRYYPNEFAEPSTSGGEDGDGGEKKDSAKKATIGPWRKRIASWMYDVVDHFQYDRNVVSIALRYIDQYVGHLLLEQAKQGHRRADSGIGRSRGNESGSTGAQPIKRRHFQLIAVTSLYLSIKVHGELMENDPVSDLPYDVVGSLIDEVDGRTFLGRPLSDDDDKAAEEEDASSQESDDDLRAVSHKLTDLKRRHRKGRWSMHRLSQLGLPLGHPGGGGGSSVAPTSDPSRPPKQPKHAHSSLPYKPRKRGMLSGPLRLHSFVELSRGLFTSADITDTEKKILAALDYVVNPPTGRRFAGELLRLLALSYCGVVDGESSDAEATAGAAERILGLERRDILARVLEGTCRQIEGAASVPRLSIGCLPSVLAYSAVLNAVEEEFERAASTSASDGEGAQASGMGMEMEEGGSPQLEDFQRHYRRYSRSQGPSSSDLESDRELFLEAWKEQFLVTVFHATNCFLSPDSQEIFKVREMLLDEVKDGEGAAVAGATSPASGGKPQADGSKKRSPRSPRSVAVAASNPRRGGSFFSRQSSTGSSCGATLLSPYDCRGRATPAGGAVSGGGAFRSLSGPASVRAPARSYYKQASEPIHESATAGKGKDRFARAQTPDVADFRNQASGRASGYEVWRSTGEAFQPPNPGFFSA